MARIAGVDIPRDKRVDVALRYIYGIGPTRARHIVTGVDLDGGRKIPADLPTVLVHQPDPGRADRIVDPGLRDRANRRLRTPPRSQRAVTKLARSSLIS